MLHAHYFEQMKEIKLIQDKIPFFFLELILQYIHINYA